ncbi:tripartite tricarboxylate transporter substrate binding protein (plasmid) [Cupriavidus basilensis]
MNILGGFRAQLALLLLACSAYANGQAVTFPAKPIRIVVPFTAGSGADADSRFYGELLAKKIGQPVIVENRPGASGIIAVRAVKAAPADGYTMLIATSSPMTVNAVTIKHLPYDPFVDFKPVVGVAVNPAAFVVKADSPYRSIRDLVAAAKREQRPISIGDYSAGYQLMATWLGTATGAQVNHISYKGGAQMVTDVIGGQLETAVTDPSSILPMHREGRVRIIATTGTKRMEALPEVPTLIESGVEGFETYIWSSFFVRSETPSEVTALLTERLSQVMRLPEAQAYRKARGQELLDLKGDGMRNFQLREYERFKRVADSVGLRKQ